MEEKYLIGIDNPIVKNHQVYGNCVLPGLAYIDMVYQLFREQGYDHTRLELRNLSIFNPLIASKDKEVTLHVRCEEVASGRWRIVMEGGEDNKRYATAEMLQTAPVVFAKEPVALDWAKQENKKAKEVLDLEAAYEFCRELELLHTGFMKAKGKVYGTATEIWVDISPGDESRAVKEAFMFHPVLLDGAAIGTWGLLATRLGKKRQLSLPLFYESFKATGLLQESCFVRIKSSSLREKKELSYLSMEFFDTTGRKVAELLNFAGKAVKEPGQLGQVETERPRAAEVETFLRQLLAERMRIPAEKINTQVGYYEMGLDSTGLLGLVEELTAKIGVDLSPTLLFEYTTIAELAAYLSEHHSVGFASGASAGLEDVDESSGPREKGDIAIIGMAGRYPQAGNLWEYWENLCGGKECITEIPSSRWERQEMEGLESPTGKRISQWGGFIDDVDCFDAEFFRISPRHAEVFDPQERLFLETCWEAVEDAGYTPATLTPLRKNRKGRKVGVFAGVMHSDYLLLSAEAAAKGSFFPLPLSSASISNRTSYFFDFCGPSITLDTMCSSSLTAVHLAAGSIRCGECEVALAGGVNLSLHPYKYMSYGLLDMYSDKPHCHAFGSEGDGYISAEGVGVVVLKPLAKAVEDGDNIYAVIKGSAINHGGTTSGFTVPNPAAQAELIISCLEEAGINPRTISYVEAAAVGSALGDPIEVAALTKAFRRYTADRQYCAIGSVKSNIGHAESAAGISQLMKAVLQIRYGELLPSINAEPLNPEIDFTKTPFYLQKEKRSWERPEVNIDGEKRVYPRRGAVNSFGAGGSNVHMIIEEHLLSDEPLAEKELSAGAAGAQVVILSAKNPSRLQAVAQGLLEFLESRKGQGGISLQDLAYTFQVGRVAWESRLAMVVANQEELVQGLKVFLAGEKGAKNVFVSVKENENAVGGKNTGKSGSAKKPSAADDLMGVAAYWAQGGEVDWKTLHKGARVKRISLPTYPFERKRYWVSRQNDEEAVEGSREGGLQEYLVRFLQQELRLAEGGVDLDRNLQEYGVDSIITMKLLRSLEKEYRFKAPLRSVLEHPTISSLAEHLMSLKTEAERAVTKKTGIEEENGYLEKFKQGLLTLEEIDELIEKGEIV